MSLGKQIRIHRQAQGLTLEQLSELSGVDVGTISALENRGSKRSQYASKLAKGLGMTLEALEATPVNYDHDGSKAQNNVAELPKAYETESGLKVADDLFMRKIKTGLETHDLPDHIRQTILTLISSSPEK